MPPSLTFPPASAMVTLDGSNYSHWESKMQGLLEMNCYDLHLTGTKPTDDTEWDAVEKMLLGLFKVYIRKDVMMLIKDDTKFGTVKLKWNELKCIYGSSGSMATFNSWAALTSATLDDTKPMFP